MYKFNKILIALDQTEMDVQLIKSVCTICKLSGSKTIYFINVLRDFNFPSEVLQEFPDILDKALSERRIHIESLLAAHFECPGVKTEIIIAQGQPTKEIMGFIAKKKIDLVVVGQKNEKATGGIIITRLARRAGCSLLVIPKAKHLELKRLFIPLDFSTYSKMALEKALAFYSGLKEKPEMLVQNVFSVPSGYHYTGKTYEEFAKIMQENAKKELTEFITPINKKQIPLEILFTLDKEDDVIKYIYEEAKKQKADIIIIGAKGRTSAAALFIGSKAENLIYLNTEIPMLIVRPKGKNAGLWEYLKEI